MLLALYFKQVFTVDKARLEQLGTPKPDRKSKLEHWKDAFRTFLELACGHPVIAGFGSARDSVLKQPETADCQEITRLVGKLSYALGIGLMTGQFHRGWMWSCLNAWLIERKGFLDAAGPAARDGVFIGGVPLMEPDFAEGTPNGPTAEQIALLRLIDAKSPPFAFFEARTPAIMTACETLVCMYGPDGWGTAEELTRDGLSGQHRDVSLTVWTGRPSTAMRKIVLLDCKLPCGIWSYDWMRVKGASNMRLTTTSASDWEDVHVIRVGNPDTDGGILANLPNSPVKVCWFPDAFEAAAFIVDLALGVHESLRLAYIGMLGGETAGS